MPATQKTLYLFLLGVCGLWCGAAAAEPPQDSAASAEQRARAEQLSELKSRLATLQKELNEVRGRRDHVREELTAVDRLIGKKVLGLRRIDRRLGADQRRLNELQLRERKQKAALGKHRDALAEQARATFMLGRQEYLKVLLNQEDPARAARALTYYRYFNEARAARITEITERLSALAVLESEIAQRRAAQAQLQAEQTSEKTALEATQVRRRTLLSALNRELGDRTQQIERLKEDEARLERLLHQIDRVLPSLPEPPPQGGQFADYRGRLPLPVVGRLRANFGEPKGLGRLKWRGILVESDEGRDIRAVFRGRVAYADWLRGFGLLLILDHGGGYMTLYGHNQSLYKEVGEWVEAGEVVAATGATGDTPVPGVYFEVRHNGKPRDPMQWCSRRGTA